MNQRQVLVTGGTGFLGSYLIQKLLEQGYKVHATKRSSSRMDLVQNVMKKVVWLEGDILDNSFLSQAFQGIDTVFHCAAMVSFSPEDDDIMYKVNVEGTRNVVQACIKNKATLIHASSVAAIGRSNEKMITEKSKWVESSQNTPYARSKYLGESEVWKGKKQGLNMGIVNPSTILGAGFWDTGSSKLFTTVFKGLLFYPIGMTGFVDVRDVASAMLTLSQRPQCLGKRYIINAENWKYQAVFNTMADALNVKRPYIRVGYILKNISWRLEKLRSRITGKKPFITKHTAHISSLSYEYDNSLSIQELNMNYHSLSKTIQDTSIKFLKDL